MFGSISNWVNENKPAMPSMPTMPAMPTVNMPQMPQMPGFLHKNKEPADEAVIAEAGAASDEVPVKSESGELSTAAVVSEGDVSEKVESAEGAAGEEAVLEEGETAAKNGPGFKILDSSKEIGSNIGNMLFSFGSKTTSSVRNATSSLKDVIQKKTIIGDFSKENEKFINDKKTQQRKEDAAVAPWVGYNEEEKLKEQILELSKDSRNFLRAPPSGVEFHFDFNTTYPVAMAILEEDPSLSEMRFKLVPKQVKEENFWLNYFYRISLIKQTCTLDELNKQNEQESSTEAKPVSSKASPAPKQDTLEFVSDDHENGESSLNDEEIKNELKQLNLNSNASKIGDDEIDEAEWDIKPEDMDNISAEELEKEINSMLG